MDTVHLVWGAWVNENNAEVRDGRLLINGGATWRAPISMRR